MPRRFSWALWAPVESKGAVREFEKIFVIKNVDAGMRVDPARYLFDAAIPAIGVTRTATTATTQALGRGLGGAVKQRYQA